VIIDSGIESLIGKGVVVDEGDSHVRSKAGYLLVVHLGFTHDFLNIDVFE
jgi:hypothetical protein